MQTYYSNKDCANEGERQTVHLYRAEAKLIAAIRSIEFGEIEGLKIKNRLPVGYRAAKKTCKF